MANKSLQSILVIGGAGYIGSHVAKILQKRGLKPVILDDFSTGHASIKDRLPQIPFYTGCMSDHALLTRILQEREIQAVMHFSAKAVVGESVQDPLSYYETNVAKTVSLLKTLRKSGISRFVFSSTCATYGEPTLVPIPEAIPQNPINPYGQSKLMVERILQDCFRSYGLSSAVLRYFNAAGADPEAILGEDHRPETHLIPIILENALGRRQGLTINGNDYPTKDGTCIRDYIHVNDLADGHIKALEYISANPGCHDFNLGTGFGYSNLEVLKMVESVTGKSVSYKVGARRPGDPPVLVAAPEKANRLLNWKPEYDLKGVVQTAYQWMVKNPRGYDTELSGGS